MVEKFTIFAVKAPAGATLDSAFAEFRGEVTKTFPTAVSVGEALNLKDGEKGTPDAIPEWRSEAFLVDRDVGQTTEELTVAVQAGWELEIRNSYLGAPNSIVVAKDDADNGAVAAVGDRIISAVAYVRVSRTLGK